MFSGLIRNIGKIVNISNDTITISSNLKPKLGASIAINGICLTNIHYSNGCFNVNLSTESRKLIAMENIYINAKVHLEEALKLSDRLDGHIVQGHIDSIGEIDRINENKLGIDFWISYKDDINKLIIPKGSICIDGVSLTVNECYKNCFRITIVPHTFKNTLFNTYEIKRRVNIETDILARSINHLLQSNNSSNTSWHTIDSILTTY